MRILDDDSDHDDDKTIKTNKKTKNKGNLSLIPS